MISCNAHTPMFDPVHLLLILAGLVAVACLLFWPRRGCFAWLRRVFHKRDLEIREDALKHLYDFEYVGSPGSIQSLAGALKLDTTRATRLALQLEASGLVRTGETGLQLTDDGRDYALRIIRAHRLWETYLANRTGFAESEWHSEADRREHQTTMGQLQHLVRSTGNPRFDPHGDPIPTEEGELPLRRGVRLSDAVPGSHATVVHVEDEPEAVYAQLRAQRIRVNQRVLVREKTQHRIVVEVEGEDYAMTPIVADNVWITPAAEDATTELVDHLSSLKIGETRQVVGISPVCQGLQRRRMLDLGIVPGTQVTAVMKSPTGDPTGYRIRGAVIALRQSQAEMIQIQRKAPAELPQ